MTRKHFVLIAEVISRMENDKARYDVASDMAYELSTVNPRFERARFMSACNAVKEASSA